MKSKRRIGFDTLTGMLRLEHVQKEYDTVVAVRDLTLEIPAGEIFGLIGPNGAGKTTTLRMCCGLLEPSGGKIEVDGIDVSRAPQAAQAKIGFLSDFFSLYEDLKAWEYLDYFARAYRVAPQSTSARVEEVLHEIGLEAKRDSLVRGLSRGMKQRLGIGRAVIHRPKLLLLDEPASGLDPKARIELRNLLKNLRNQGSTIIVSSHILPDLEDFSTSIGIMEKGVMVRSGRLSDLRRTVASTTARNIIVRTLGNATSLKDFAQSRNLALRNGGGDAILTFEGDDTQLAQLLRDMITAGVIVTEFHEVKQSVEDLYVHISRNEVQ